MAMVASCEWPLEEESGAEDGVGRNHARYVALGMARCGRFVREACPAKWAVTCLDHFNCDSILEEDVLEPAKEALGELGFSDVWTGRASACDAACRAERHHLLVNGNLIDETWAALFPPERAVLFNAEQLVERDAASARAAARVAVEVFAHDVAVAEAGRRALRDATNGTVLGATVDDARRFVALDAATAARYAWLDYSYRNLDLLAKHGVCALPKGIGLARPVPEDPRTPRDIAAVHLGGLGVPRRSRLVDALRAKGHAALLVEGAFRQDRAALLDRARLGLCVKRSTDRAVPELPRILAYLARGLPVLAETLPGLADSRLQAELDGPAVKFLPLPDLLHCADLLLANASAALDPRRDAARRLAASRRERFLLAPALAALFPACRLASP